MSGGGAGKTRLMFGAGVVIGAFLLFLVEPIAAKQLLPILGGSSAVWMTCLVFFQLMLLAGYGYADWLSRRVRPELQGWLHLTLLAVGVLLLGLQLKFPAGVADAAAHPVATIFVALGTRIGLPFLLLAATSPLLQVWLARRDNGRVRYKLFGLSNAGSLLALVAYPALVEPRLSLRSQWALWMGGFVAFSLLCAAIAKSLAHAPAAVVEGNHASDCSATDPIIESGMNAESRIQWWRRRVLWFLLPMAAAMQLSAVTGHLTQNVAAIPLLWVVPLGVYLITFIVAFDAPWLYRRWLIVRLLAVMLAALGYMLTKTDFSLPLGVSILFFLVEILVACLFCHAELYALRPADAREATRFYLLIAAGGVTGTFLIGIASPLIFAANYDVAIAFFWTAAVAIAVTWRDGWAQRLLWVTGSAMLLVLLGMLHQGYVVGSVVATRNFYGALRVRESHTPPQSYTARTLMNGSITHGMQWFAPEFRRSPLTYYAEDSGVGVAIENCCEGRQRRIGVIGLGAGTLATYGRPGDTIRFYEINPVVRPIAQHFFTYLRESEAQITYAEGDARVSLSRESPENFDVLAVDAFSGDAIPLHLLTTEAMELYKRHLSPGGVLAFHVSNQFLDLTPEVGRLAQASGMTAVVVHSAAADFRGEYSATWVLVSSDAAFFARPAVFNVARPVENRPDLRVWTDDYSGLLPVLRWKEKWARQWNAWVRR